MCAGYGTVMPWLIANGLTWMGRLLFCGLISWPAITADVAASGPPPSAPAGSSAASIKATAPSSIREGPWGILEVSTAYLEAPPALMESLPKPNQRPVWHFSSFDEPTLRRLCEEAGLSETTIRSLLTPEHCVAEDGGITVLPPAELVMNLAPAARQVVYEALARQPRNSDYQIPYLVFGSLEEWLGGTRLSEKQRNVFRQTIWQKGGSSAFSDLSLLIQSAASGQEIEAARRAITRVRSVMVKVRLGAQLSEAAFCDYWSAGQRNSDVIPLLRAHLARDPLDAIDIALLLPPLGRERLYTYPSLGDAVGGRLPDCNWTTLNFFEDRPRFYYLDTGAAYFELMQNYERIAVPSALGDVICFVDDAGRVHHSCIYIADEVVFTKNGQSFLAPWVLMRLSEVAAHYANAEVKGVAIFRMKNRSESR